MNSSSVESKALCSNYTLHVCAPVGSSMEELWKHLAAQCILLPIVIAVGIAYVAKTNGYIGTRSVGDEIASSVRDVTQNYSIKLSDKDFFEAARDEEVEEDLKEITLLSPSFSSKFVERQYLEYTFRMSKDGFIDTMASITALSIQQSVTMLVITIGIAYLGVARPEDLYASVAQMLTVFVNISVRELASSAKAESWGYVLLTFHLYALIVFQLIFAIFVNCINRYTPALAILPSYIGMMSSISFQAFFPLSFRLEAVNLCLLIAVTTIAQTAVTVTSEFPVMDMKSITNGGDDSVYSRILPSFSALGWAIIAPATLLMAFKQEIKQRRDFLLWKKKSNELIKLRSENDQMDFQIRITQRELDAANEALKAEAKAEEMIFEELRIPIDDIEREGCILLGKGAFGSVFKSSYMTTPVAIKVFGDSSAYFKLDQVPLNSKTKLMEFAYKGDMDEEQLQARFRGELMIHALIESPFVLECLGGIWNEERTTCGLVIELAPRGDMSSFVGKGLETTLPMLVNVAKGMEYLHGTSCEVLHLDLKPENIMIFANFRAKIGDFGVAKRIHDLDPRRPSEERRMTTHRMQAIRSRARSGKKFASSDGAVGTPGFVDPRMLAMETRGDTKCDVFSFAIVIYLCLIERRASEVLELKNGKAMQMHREGLRLEIPSTASDRITTGARDALIKLMMDCWAENHIDRPAFKKIVQKLRQIMQRERLERRATTNGVDFRRDRRGENGDLEQKKGPSNSMFATMPEM